MQILNLKPNITFIYGVCTEDKLSDMVSDAESEGCEFLQIMPGMMMPPQSKFAIPGANVQPIAVMKILVRMPEDKYSALIKSRQAPMINGAH